MSEMYKNAGDPVNNQKLKIAWISKSVWDTMPSQEHPIDQNTLYFVKDATQNATSIWVGGTKYGEAMLDDEPFTSAYKLKIDGIASGANVVNINYDSTNNKITKTVNGVTSDVVTVAQLKSALNITKSDIGLGNVDNTADANKSVASAGKLTTAYNDEGVKVDGSAAVSHYATCPTAATTKAKVATIAPATSNFALVQGARVFVKFTYVINVASATLNVNGTGAKAIYYNGAALTAGLTDAGGTYEFVYNGTQWELVGDINTDTTDLSKMTGVLDIPNGGTGASTASGIRTNIELDNVTNDKQVKGLSSGTTSGHVVTWGEDGYTVADSGFTIGTSVPADAVFTDTKYTAATSNPIMDGTAAVGTSAKYAREDHVHPTDTTRAAVSTTVTNVAYDSTNKKITKTINGTTSDVVTVATLKSGFNLTKSDVGLGNVDNTADANKSVASAGKLTTAYNDEGVNSDGSTAVSHYATCSTAATTAAKVATVSPTTSNFALATGARVFVKFTYVIDVASATLNVNSTGAKPIYYNGAALAKGLTDAGGTYEFVYNGTQWELVGDLDTNTTYTPASSAPSMDGTAAVGTSVKYAREDHVHPSDTSKVDKVSGKGLSTNDYTTAEKNKLAGVAEGAEVNQNAFSNVVVGSTTISASSETDTLEIVKGSNITLTPDDTNKTLTIAATNTTYSAGTAALIEAGANTSNRVWSAKILHDYIASAVGSVDAMRFLGTLGTEGDITSLPTENVKVGDTYRVITAGTYASQTCEVGDLIIATSDTPTWTVAQTNIDGAITSITGTAPISVDGTGHSRIISVAVDSTYSSTGTNPVNGTAVKAAIDTLSVASKGGAASYITTISETGGKISATAAAVGTTYSSTGTTAVSGKAIKAALDTLSVAAAGGSGSYITTISETGGKISATAAAFPASLPASDTVSTYSSTGTAPVNGKAIKAALNTLSNSGIDDYDGQYVANIQQISGAISAEWRSPATNYVSTATDPISGKGVAAALNTLSVAAVGGSGSYITTVSESGGKISATAAAFPASLPASNTVSTYASNGTAPVNGTAVKAALDTLSVAAAGGSGSYITTISETGGKISATAAAFPASLPASNTVSTYSSTGTVPVSGKSIKAALDTLSVAAIGGSGSYITTISESGGKISATAAAFPTIPTSLPASDTTSTYSSTGTAPVNGTAVKAALDTLSVAAAGGTNSYITTISESGGKIMATALTVATIYSSTGTTAVSGKSIKAALDTLSVAAAGGNGSYITTISETGGKISATAAAFPASLPASNTVSTYASNGTAPVNGKAVKAALDTLSVSSPTASTATSTTFIDTVSQSGGKITATKKTLPTASTTVAGITTVGASGGAAAYSHTHSEYAASNHTHTQASLGQGYATCATAAATAAKVGTLSGYELITGGYVSVKFTYAVPASATLNINSKGAKAIYYKGSAISANVIKAGDVATFVYNGSQYHLVSVDGSSGLRNLVDGSGDGSVRSINSTSASGTGSIAEGLSTTASGDGAHAEGIGTQATRSAAHAEGSGTIASGVNSHAEGTGTVAYNASQHVFGSYNVLDPSGVEGTERGTYIEIVGNGTSGSPSNARTLDWSGNETLAGSITVGERVTLLHDSTSNAVTLSYNSTTKSLDFIFGDL